MKKELQYSYLFGPVPSRRLGMSLGVDLVPPKTCSMNCVYCESGITTDFTSERKSFFPVSDIIAELDCFLAEKPQLDYITFSGAGEPCLYLGIGQLIEFIKEKYPEYKIALLTNSMMLTDPDVFAEVKAVDLIIPSLDAASSDIFMKINRPVSSVDCGKLITALADFKKESDAKFWLEIFVVSGVNTTEKSMDSLAEAVAQIKPDKVQLNTLDRPGVETWVQPASKQEMDVFAKKIAKFAKVEIVGKFRQTIPIKSDTEAIVDIEARVIALIQRRPCTYDDILTSLHCDKHHLEKVLDDMLSKEKIIIEHRPRGVFYKNH